MTAPAELVRRTGWDAVVVGAGPTGSSAAYHLARAGRRVLLLDRRRFPRDKICGDGLTRAAVAALTDMGTLEALDGAQAVRGRTGVVPGRGCATSTTRRRRPARSCRAGGWTTRSCRHAVARRARSWSRMRR